MKKKYNPEFHNKIAELAASHGMTNEEIAKQMNIRKSTLHNWFKKYPELKKIVDNAKRNPDKLVEDILFKRTQGYEYEEREVRLTKAGEKLGKITKKHVQPSDVAIIFWLKNRQPERWRDRHDLNISGIDEYKQQRKKLSDIIKKTFSTDSGNGNNSETDTDK